MLQRWHNPWNVKYRWCRFENRISYPQTHWSPLFSVPGLTKNPLSVERLLNHNVKVSFAQRHGSKICFSISDESGKSMRLACATGVETNVLAWSFPSRQSSPACQDWSIITLASKAWSPSVIHSYPTTIKWYMVFLIRRRRILVGRETSASNPALLHNEPKDLLIWCRSPTRMGPSQLWRSSIFPTYFFLIIILAVSLFSEDQRWFDYFEEFDGSTWMAGRQIHALRSDRGGEWTSHEFFASRETPIN